MQCNGSESLMLRVKQTVAFQKIYDAVAQHMGLDPTSFSLHYHGQRLLPNKTPTDLNIHNNAVLNHFLTFPRPYDRDVVSDRDAKITLHIESWQSSRSNHIKAQDDDYSERFMTLLLGSLTGSSIHFSWSTMVEDFHQTRLHPLIGILVTMQFCIFYWNCVVEMLLPFGSQQREF
ncbi:hypothetical protein PCASD_25418 [Puccinia coronata f. sp. avenae]|uniref:Rad60/SUMO-like domain-containing protein n=1 Tax=Puccinia coronata f. sp. avenae TaxID=200324 RepID=A0A2N5RYN5_9BASI|nr:hypothetical protein PCASD_25418 [Puccinia coronata f. sp. avenae]